MLIFAYVDPSSSDILVQVLVAGAVVVAILARVLWPKLRNRRQPTDRHSPP
jgi:hypothetical protein